MSASTFNFDSALRAILEAGSAERTLRIAHRPCQRLIMFVDFFQDVLLKALEHRLSFRGNTEAELIGWIRSIGDRRMIDILRSSRKRLILPLPDQVEDIASVSPLEIVRLLDEAIWLEKTLGTLDEQEREIIDRRYHRGEKWTEIAQTMELRPNTLAQKHLRALNKLRKCRVDLNRDEK